MKQYQSLSGNKHQSTKAIYRIRVMMNRYHSLDAIEATEQERAEARRKLREMVVKESKCLGRELRTRLMLSLNNKEVWEELREGVFNQ